MPQRASSGAALRATERVLLLAVWIGNDTLYAEPTWKRQLPCSSLRVVNNMCQVVGCTVELNSASNADRAEVKTEVMSVV